MSRAYIEFLLDGEVVRETHLDPTMSVLQYLRERRLRTGTKEGCAEGDCGACTVVLGELVSGAVRYRSVNACILFMPTLDGKELRTVESLGSPDAPHEIQKLVADKNASQCGFCTPGIVMSLHALQMDDLPYTRDNIDEALAGNLCRCTGYGPIIDAAMAMEPIAKSVDNSLHLRGLEHQDLIEFTANIHGDTKQFFIPKTRTQLETLLSAHPDATILAGGTDIGLWVTKHHKTLMKIIYLGDVAELKRCEQNGRHLVIGAGVTYAQATKLIGEHYPEVNKIITRIGAAQVRNMGTLCGNIANGSPIGDMPPLLIALDSILHIANEDGAGSARLLPLEAFFIDYGKQDLAPGGVIIDVSIPIPRPHQKLFAYKISKRFESDISALLMGMSFVLEDGKCTRVRIAFGGMAATPKRAENAEKMLEGKTWSEANIRKTMSALENDFAPISDMRASKDYRMNVAKNLILKAWLESEAGTPLQILEAVYDL